MTSTPRIIETAILFWEGRTIEVTWERDWLENLGVTHLTVTCINPPKDRLPVTETGYRSAFIDRATITDGDYTGYVRQWLDETATAKAWLAFVEATRQLNLL